MNDPHYQGLLVYNSDIVVRQDDPYISFSDLGGKCWICKERVSYSGFYTICHRLVQQEKSLNFLEEALESGAHVNSLQMVVDGRVNVTAIDSTLLDCEFARQPALVKQARVIESVGPSPILPWVISRQLPQDLQEELRGLCRTCTSIITERVP